MSRGAGPWRYHHTSPFRVEILREFTVLVPDPRFIFTLGCRVHSPKAHGPKRPRTPGAGGGRLLGKGGGHGGSRDDAPVPNAGHWTLVPAPNVLSGSGAGPPACDAKRCASMRRDPSPSVPSSRSIKHSRRSRARPLTHSPPDRCNRCDLPPSAQSPIAPLPGGPGCSAPDLC